MRESTVGGQELALLRHIADRGAVTVGEAVDEFGELAQPRALDRPHHDGTPAAQGSSLPPPPGRRLSIPDPQVVGGIVEGGRCAASSIGTSADPVTPFLAYLSEGGEISDSELRELEQIVARLNAGQRKER